MSGSLLLCTDLDRTLLPNGEAPESPRARELFRRLCARDGVTLVYVTGRDTGRVAAAIREYDLPQPDYVVADVGTTITSGDGSRWRVWDEHIAGDWGGRENRQLAAIVGELPGLTLQDDSRQGRFKLSYEARPADTASTLAAVVTDRLRHAGLVARVVASQDEIANVGLVDVLPGMAGKLAAIEFLAEQLGRAADEVVFAGDSGNDLDVLVSTIPAVLVANAAPEVRDRALQETAGANLYLAQGGVLGLNGNYAAGILEGVLHYQPGWAAVLEEAT